MSLQENAPPQPAIPPGASPVRLAPPIRRPLDPRVKAIMDMYPGIDEWQAKEMLEAILVKQKKDSRKRYDDDMRKIDWRPRQPVPNLPPNPVPVTDSDGEGLHADGPQAVVGSPQQAHAAERARLRALIQASQLDALASKSLRETLAGEQARRGRSRRRVAQPGDAQPIQPPSQGTPYGFS